MPPCSSENRHLMPTRSQLAIVWSDVFISLGFYLVFVFILYMRPKNPKSQLIAKNYIANRWLRWAPNLNLSLWVFAGWFYIKHKWIENIIIDFLSIPFAAVSGIPLPHALFMASGTNEVSRISSLKRWHCPSSSPTPIILFQTAIPTVELG